MISNKITDSIVNTVLRQMGATKIKTLPASINIVTFKFSEDFKVKYVYEMKENDNIYLQRVAPYPYFLGEPNNSDALIEMIKKDLDGYVSAHESDNFPLYMDIERKAEIARNKLQHLLLGDEYANPEDLQRLSELMTRVIDLLSDSESNTSHVKPVMKK
ncbi:MAG: hypothetical protein SOR72_01870 [Hornefia sp.]|nr:hypothetical protein [Hornefia sp.]